MEMNTLLKLAGRSRLSSPLTAGRVARLGCVWGMCLLASHRALGHDVIAVSSGRSAAVKNVVAITDFETGAAIGELQVARKAQAEFRDTAFEDFPNLIADGEGQVWLAVVARPLPGREIRVYRLAEGGRHLVATLRPAKLTGVGAPVLAPLPSGCLVAFAVEQRNHWRVAVTRVKDEATEPTFQYLTAGGTANIEPSVASCGDRYAVVWESNAAGPRGIFAAWLSDNGASPPERISSPEFVSLNPTVVATDDGSLFAAWDSVRGAEADLYGAWCRTEQWEAERRITHDPRLERFASLATNGKDVWLAWQAQSHSDDRVTHLDVQQAVVAKLEKGGQLAAPQHLFDDVVQDDHLLLRPRLTFDAQGRLWLTVRRSLMGVAPATGRRPIGQHSGWEPLLWCYQGDRWQGPSRLTETPGRWRPIPIAWGRDGRGIAAVQRDDYPAGWGIDTGIADDWSCDVRLLAFRPSELSSARSLQTIPLRMPPTDYRLAERIRHSGADFPRQTAVVAGKRLTLYWGDLHDHTDLSVCQRAFNPPIRENYNTKRDIERLDFTAITDHGYNLDHPLWQWSAEQVRANYDPDKFVTLLGEEWTSDHVSYDPKIMVPMIGTGASVELRRYGHHNIIFRDPYYKTFYDSRDRDATPQDVWEQLEDKHALMIPHQLADLGNRPTDWSFHDEWRQPLAEIFQTRGSYEHLGCPQQARRSMAVKGHFLQDAWERGHVIGVIASPDHGGGRGKAGVWAGQLTRESLFEAFHDRHTFGTTGVKLGLLVTSGDHMMGDKVVRHDSSPIELRVRAVADRVIEKLVVLRNNTIVHAVEPGQRELDLEWIDESTPPKKGLWYYVRLHVSGNHLAWSSPIWFLPAE